MSHGHVMEIFSAVQGEGPWLGIRQIFIRLFRCNLRCVWCDTPESFKLTGSGFLEVPPESRQFTKFENPISVDKIIKWLEPFLEMPHHSISFTGGEPLVQKDFLKELWPALKNKGEKIFLETGGSLPEIFQELLPWADYISMDLKLPSSTQEKPLWEKHKVFLKLSSQKQCAVKIVLTADTKSEELAKGLNLVHEAAPHVCIILQPVTPWNGISPPSEKQMLQWQTLALEKISDVRVIPQVHKLMGQR